MANTHLQKTFSASANRTRQTISVWVKRTGGLGTTQAIFSVYTGGTYYAHLRFKSDDSIQLYNYNDINIRTNRKFRDTNGWYHIHVIIDTPNSTSTDRIRLYVNGERETDLANTTYPAQNGEIKFGDSNLHSIGSYDSSSYFDGCMSHFHFITNNAYEPTLFGETDSTTGEWKIKTSPSVTYSTNSFFILKDGNSGTDQSGQSNDFSVTGGTLTKTEDCPSNVFASLNSLANIGSANVYENGSTTITGNSNWGANPSTIATGTTGKYYAECKVVAQASAYSQFGIMSVDAVPNWTLGYVHTSADAVVWSIDYRSGQSKIENNNSSIIQTPTQFSDGDIIGMAIDVDNGKIYFHRNGTYVTYSGNVQNPSSGSYGISLPTSTSGYHIMGNAYPNAKISINFGNGYFGTTAVSSAGTNASNIGIFEYDVPTGYTALSTKGLNE